MVIEIERLALVPVEAEYAKGVSHIRGCDRFSVQSRLRDRLYGDPSAPRIGRHVAPGLTAEVAESLYGGSAAQICDALNGGISSAESMLLTLNPSGRRAKLLTTDAIAFGRLVVQTYCPGELSTYDDLVSGIDGTETTD